MPTAAKPDARAPNVLIALAFAGILLLGAALRFWGLRFGLPHTAARPDEEFVVATSLAFFSGDFNPHFFQWPSLFFYVAHGVAWVGYLVSRALGRHHDLQGFLSSVHEDPAWFYVSLRALSGAAGVSTIGVVYSLARALFDRSTALLAALFLSVAYLHARDSHFGVLDVTVTLLIVATVRLVVSPLAPLALWFSYSPRRSFVLAGICAGLATSIKYNAAAVGIAAVAVAVLRVTERRDVPSRAAIDLAAFALAFGAGFAIGTPYALLDARAFAAGLREQGLHFREGHGLRIGNGWLHHLAFSLRYGLGLPLLGAALAGFVVMGATARRAALVVGSFPLLYFAVIGAGQTAFVRYAIPVVPFLCIAAGFAVSRLGTRLDGRIGRWRTAVVTAAVLLLAAPPLVAIVRFDRIVSETDTRVLAADWLRARMAPGDALYESGAPYAHPHVAWPRSKRDHRLVEFDRATERFTTPDRRLPDWIVTVGESSPRLYSRTPYEVTALLSKHYDLVQEFSGVRGRERESWFDRQDAIFLPFSNLSLRHRPGPHLRIYRRKTDADRPF